MGNNWRDTTVPLLVFVFRLAGSSTRERKGKEKVRGHGDQEQAAEEMGDERGALFYRR